LVEYAFKNHILFQDTKNKAFSYFMSKEQYPKHLANFCDYEMKQGIKGLNDNQVDEKLNNIINIFKCLNNKLIFQIEYAKKLSDRLLANRSQSIIAEKNLISKLKAEAGVTYVGRMTTMLHDLDNSKNIMDTYKNKNHRVNFNITLGITKWYCSKRTGLTKWSLGSRQDKIRYC
jgi:hypothetical protein